MYVPYPQQDLITYGGYDPLNRYLAARGYEVVVADMVGTGASTGVIEEPFTRREGREPAAIVDWLADRSWCSGRVGMFGKSYGGITALDAAAQQPDALEAIVPIHTPFEGVRNAYTYGGLFEFLTIGMDWSTLMQALAAKPPSNPQYADAYDVWERRLDRLQDHDPWLFQFLEHGPEDDYWTDKDVPVEEIAVPVLAVGGWRDPYTEDTLRYVERVPAETRVLLGPWGHVMPHRGHEAAIDFRRQVADWFDRWLRDDPNATPDRPRFRLWTTRAEREGQWRARDQWPTVDDAPENRVTYAITPGGLRSEFGDRGVVREQVSADASVGVASTEPYGARIDPPPTNADDARTTTFETPPLDRPLELTGTGAAVLRVRATTANPTIVVRLADVTPSGRGRLVTSGALRGRSRDGQRGDDPLPVDEPTTIGVPLEPTSHVVASGHRLRLAVGTGFFPELRPTPAAEDFTIMSSAANPSRLAFPGRSRPELAFDDAIEMAPPGTGIPPSVSGSDGTTRWKTTREHVDGTATVVKAHERTLDLPHGTMSSDAHHRATVAADDPGSLTATNSRSYTVENGRGTYVVAATNEIHRTRARARTTVTHDGDPVFESEWEWSA